MKGEKNMGKKYKKPRVMFENLEFNSAIASCKFAYASNCGYVLNASTEEMCVQMVEHTESDKVYIGEGSCRYYGYCYHNSSGDIGSNLTSGS